jgi:hypothetical protein
MRALAKDLLVRILARLLLAVLVASLVAVAIRGVPVPDLDDVVDFIGARLDELVDSCLAGGRSVSACPSPSYVATPAAGRALSAVAAASAGGAS